MSKHNFLPGLLIFSLSLLFLLPFLGKANLFDWDEINFAECSREMIMTGDYSTVMINYKEFWEKPPLFFWMQAVSMKLFGINAFAARFPNAICGAVTLTLLFYLGSHLHSRRFGLWWTLFMIFSMLPHFYFRSGIIDPWFNLFIFCGVAGFAVAGFSTDKRKRFLLLILSAISLGLATLTKGPVALLVFGLSAGVWMLLKRFKIPYSFKELVLFALVSILSSLSWFMLEAMRGNSDVIVDFINYQIRLFNTRDAGHGGPFYYHFIVLLAGCFPASVIAAGGMKRGFTAGGLAPSFHTWMLILFWVVLLLFSIVKTKIVHYSSLCYLPLTFFAAWFIIRNPENKKQLYLKLTAIIGFLIALAMLLLPVAGMFGEHLADPDIIKDPFVIEALKARVDWGIADFLPGIFLLISILYALSRRREAASVPFGILGAGSAIVLFLAAIMFVPKIERFSQGAAIDFYKSLEGRADVLAEPIGFKSYAHLFYTKRLPPADGVSYPDEPVYNPVHGVQVFAVSKIQDSIRIAETHDMLQPLYSKNGFVFWKKVKE